MIYADLERILDDTGIENKYALAMIVSTRARQLSERKTSLVETSTSELCITHSLGEIAHGDVDVTSSAQTEDDGAGLGI